MIEDEPRHYHRPRTFLGVRHAVGATWYVYECECGQELPERRIPAPAITRPPQMDDLDATSAKPLVVAHQPGPDQRCTRCGYRLGSFAPLSCPGK